MGVEPAVNINARMNNLFCALSVSFYVRFFAQEILSLPQTMINLNSRLCSTRHKLVMTS
jgi:hypothetical protein